jgi:hypothetical protein
MHSQFQQFKTNGQLPSTFLFILPEKSRLPNRQEAEYGQEPTGMLRRRVLKYPPAYAVVESVA